MFAAWIQSIQWTSLRVRQEYVEDLLFFQWQNTCRKTTFPSFIMRRHWGLHKIHYLCAKSLQWLVLQPTSPQSCTMFVPRSSCPVPCCVRACRAVTPHLPSMTGMTTSLQNQKIWKSSFLRRRCGFRRILLCWPWGRDSNVIVFLSNIRTGCTASSKLQQFPPISGPLLVPIAWRRTWVGWHIVLLYYIVWFMQVQQL